VPRRPPAETRRVHRRGHGFGQGRVLLLAASCEFRRIVGVEFAVELHEAAVRLPLRTLLEHPPLHPAGVEVRQEVDDRVRQEALDRHLLPLRLVLELAPGVGVEIEF
jgi:hypothetical protein